MLRNYVVPNPSFIWFYFMFQAFSCFTHTKLSYC